MMTTMKMTIRKLLQPAGAGLAFGLALFQCPLATAQTNWQEALAKMPLTQPAAELNRTNAVKIMLASFQRNAAVKALGFPAKFEHFAQHGNSAPRGRTPEQLHHGAHRLRICVIAIVDNRDAGALKAFATHLPQRERSHRIG